MPAPSWKAVYHTDSSWPSSVASAMLGFRDRDIRVAPAAAGLVPACIRMGDRSPGEYSSDWCCTKTSSSKSMSNRPRERRSTSQARSRPLAGKLTDLSPDPGLPR